MHATSIRIVLVSFCALLLIGCGIYTSYGFGRVAKSRLDAESVTALELSAKAASISQRFRPEVVSSKSEHKGFDILVPSATSLPCRGIDWQ